MVLKGAAAIRKKEHYHGGRFPFHFFGLDGKRLGFVTGRTEKSNILLVFCGGQIVKFHSNLPECRGSVIAKT